MTAARRRQSPGAGVYAGWLLGGIAALAAGWYVLASAPAPASADRYVEGIAGRPERVSPLFARPDTADADLAALLFDGLTAIDGSGTPRPNVAERWEVADGGRTYTFFLRSDVFWHDGERLDARDVAFTIERVQEPGFRGPATLAAQWAGAEVALLDASTLTIRLAVPSPAFLASTTLGILPEHLLSGLDADGLYDAPFNRAPVGTGPFRLLSLSDQAASLERNPSYHRGTPALDGIEFRFFADARSLSTALRTGAVDAALLGETPSASERAALEARPELAVTDLVRSGWVVLYLNNQRPPLNDTAFRRALAASIDRRALVAAGGRGLAGDGPIVPGSWAYSAGRWPGAEEAATLFREAGWPLREDGMRVRDGEPVQLELVTNADPAREALAGAVASQLRAQGVGVTVVTMSAVELLARRLEPRQYDLAIFGWDAAVDPDPYGGWHTSQIAGGGRNVAGYHDAAADALLEQARATLGTAELRDLYARFSARFVETAPSVILLYPARAYVHPDALRGLSDGLLFEAASRFRDIYAWTLD